MRSSRREFAAGALILLFGLVAISEGWRLGTGSLSAMGPGFVPMALGVLLCGLAPVITLTGHNSPVEAMDAVPNYPDWRGAICILLGAILFIVLGQRAGLAPAIFGTVFVAAMGDRTTTLRSAIALAAGVTVFGCVLFGTILRIPIPLFAVGHG